MSEKAYREITNAMFWKYMMDRYAAQQAALAAGEKAGE